MSLNTGQRDWTSCPVFRLSAKFLICIPSTHPASLTPAFSDEASGVLCELFAQLYQLPHYQMFRAKQVSAKEKLAISFQIHSLPLLLYPQTITFLYKNQTSSSHNDFPWLRGDTRWASHNERASERAFQLSGTARVGQTRGLCAGCLHSRRFSQPHVDGTCSPDETMSLLARTTPTTLRTRNSTCFTTASFWGKGGTIRAFVPSAQCGNHAPNSGLLCNSFLLRISALKIILLAKERSHFS